jgi:hypothetical protein
MSRVGFSKKLLALAAVAALGASATATKAATITFASFSDSGFNQWSYNNATGTLSATNANANFTGIGGGVINFSGAVKETLSATANGAVFSDGSGGTEQLFSGTLTFVNAANTSQTVLKVVFANVELDANPTSTSVPQLSADDSNTPGAITSFSSDFLVGGFVQPFKLNISLQTLPSMSVSGSNFASFTATAQGGFQVDQSGASPTPLPVAAWGGMSLMGAIGGVGAFIKRRRR